MTDKERKLAEINSLKQWMSERTSGQFILMLARILAANPDDPLAAPPHKKSPTSRGGRKRLAPQKQRFYLIGCSVDQMVPRFESAFAFLKQLKVTNGNSDLNTYRTELSKTKLTLDLNRLRAPGADVKRRGKKVRRKKSEDHSLDGQQLLLALFESVEI